MDIIDRVISGEEDLKDMVKRCQNRKSNVIFKTACMRHFELPDWDKLTERYPALDEGRMTAGVVAFCAVISLTHTTCMVLWDNSH